MALSPDEMTQLITRSVGGDELAAARLMELVYAELRGLAGSYLRQQRHDHTLQPTALVHEAYLKLGGHEGAGWKDRAHFIAVAATAMRQILTDHARRRSAEKRGGGGDWERVSLDRAMMPGAGEGDEDAVDVIALDECLTRLAALDPRKHRIVELRFFGGLSVDEVAEVVGVSKTTVENEWRAARAWLGVELSK
jgi:RNA polymerase sigma-70 factor (ECF subfamily)